MTMRNFIILFIFFESQTQATVQDIANKYFYSQHILRWFCLDMFSSCTHTFLSVMHYKTTFYTLQPF